MSGHSKWHNIQKTKGAQDAKRAAAFTKIAKELIVAVKEGGGITDPANNSRLATVITKAKAANMPNDNIKRCLEKAARLASCAPLVFWILCHLECPDIYITSLRKSVLKNSCLF